MAKPIVDIANFIPGEGKPTMDKLSSAQQAPTGVPSAQFTVAGRDLDREWQTAKRWLGVDRGYSAADVIKLRGSFTEEFTVARMGSQRLWKLLTEKPKGPFVRALGAVTGQQAVQMVKAGLDAIYVSGWQVAADGNPQGEMYPDQSLYACTAVPSVVERINKALRRADQIDWQETQGHPSRYWMAPLIADADSGFGGPLNVFEVVKNMIKAGAAAVHLEDQVAAEKKCGHLGGKVLISTAQHIRHLQAARLAADILNVPTLLIARTDSNAATLLTSDVDARDRQFIIPGSTRTPEGYYRVRNGIDAVIARVLAYAPYADLLWVETATPSLEEARKIADAVHARYPGKMLAYNCSPSFNWRRHLSDQEIASFQERLAEMGYVFQFVTLAGFHTITSSMFELAKGYSRDGMAAFARLQDKEFELEKEGFTAIKHQREVGTGYYDAVSTILGSSAVALNGSTERADFEHRN